MENGAIAPKEQMLHFQLYFQHLYVIFKRFQRHFYGVKG